mmetsp:Transcript_44825/g.72997  ORF Transcript_44825/g.72997 Transcript_44825/m.72997 type:complete len:272 (-) Transcript_44825:132-947(-)|eukprot:CAMPEP_0184651254 /NCGR_PEP_ID=MMETSP0308-20130426/8838_1 /TAXON_ID=38269 /ORGANISM="Gloeochaete witrockiana, Strain SAG 46.84" /LENGTH=271 /DNA_ID=CAMNT_0027085341 /DNA_START=579 /DNA_END=1394 /DNA_ORIENTATION=+
MTGILYSAPFRRLQEAWETETVWNCGTRRKVGDPNLDLESLPASGTSSVVRPLSALSHASMECHDSDCETDSDSDAPDVVAEVISTGNGRIPTPLTPDSERSVEIGSLAIVGKALRVPSAGTIVEVKRKDSKSYIQLPPLAVNGRKYSSAPTSSSSSGASSPADPRGTLSAIASPQSRDTSSISLLGMPLPRTRSALAPLISPSSSSPPALLSPISSASSPLPSSLPPVSTAAEMNRARFKTSSVLSPRTSSIPFTPLSGALRKQQPTAAV